MQLGIIGQKTGMTRVFTEDGVSIPVTVIEAKPNPIVQCKTQSTDGYSAVQVSFGEQRQQRVSAGLVGHYAKASVPTGRSLHEFRLASDDVFTTPNKESASSEETEDGDAPEASSLDNALCQGGQLTVAQFEPGAKIDVSGISLGKGYAGVIKRHNFSMQDATHGNSLAHRAPGSIGQCQTPGRVFKGKKMAGHMGAVKRTIQNLEVVRVDAENHLILVKGSIPGHKGGTVVVRPSVKLKKVG